MSNQLTEQQVLHQLNIPNFRHITKDKVMTFASMIQSMEPEVAKKALEQFPEFAKMALEAFKDYKAVMDKALDENSTSSKSCYEIYTKVIDSLEKCITEDLSFEEKMRITDKMMDVAKMAESKDSENKQFLWKTISTGAVVVIAVIGIGASILGGNTNVKLPSFKS